MGSNRTENILVGHQKEIVDRIYPFSLLNPKLIFGANVNETRELKKAYLPLVRKGFALSDQAINATDAKRAIVYRSFLTEACYEAYRAQTLDAEIWKYLPEAEVISVRGAETAPTMLRWARMADAQQFLSAAGVSTVWDSVNKYKINPFVICEFSLSSVAQRRTSYTQVLSSALYRMSKTLTHTLVSLPTTCNMDSIFLPSVFLKQKGQDDSGYIPAKAVAHSEKGFDNSVGLLIDLRNQYAYIVFRFQPHVKDWKWFEKGYAHLSAKLCATLEKIGIKNINQYGMIVDAIILCQHTPELNYCINWFKALPTSNVFVRVQAILMQQSGVNQMIQLLSLGAKESLEAEYETIAETIGGTFEKSSDSLYINKLLYQGSIVYSGLSYNLNAIKSATGPIDPFYGRAMLACYLRQVDFYKQLGVDPQRIIVIPEPDMSLPRKAEIEKGEKEIEVTKIEQSETDKSDDQYDFCLKTDSDDVLRTLDGILKLY